MNAAGRLGKRIARVAAGCHLPRRTVRMRLTLLYGGLFLASGAALLAVTYGLFERASEFTKPQLPKVPHAPAIRDLQLRSPYEAFQSKGGALPPPTQGQALPQLIQVQHQLAQDQHTLALSVPGDPLRVAVPLLLRDQHQLAQDRHQLARAVNQLAAAVHQVSRAGSAQAAQRATDSHQLLVNSGIALAIVAALALVAGWFLAGRMLRPIRTITRRAQRISSANLHERLAVEGPQDELKELGDTLDDLFGRLDAAFEAQRQFVANASHELRAPLARQRALIQVALVDPDASPEQLRGAHERVLAAERYLEQMIDGLLALTRGQAGLDGRERLDLGAIAGEALRTRDADRADSGPEIRATLAPAPSTGDPRLVERLAANLVDNAVCHNVPEGFVEVATGVRDHKAFLAVANSGPPIPAGEVERLLLPFQRLRGARVAHAGGNGLGLAIVDAIATAHGAVLSVQPRPEGGLVVEVAFPLAALDARLGDAGGGQPERMASARRTG